MRYCLFFLVLLFALAGTRPTFAEMTLHVTSGNDGVFILDGDNVDGVVAMDLMITYDATFLSNPRAELQGGTLTDVFVYSPGVLTVKTFRDDPDMMFQLQLSFEKSSDAPGGITNVTATVRDTAGRSIQVPVNIIQFIPAQSESPESRSDSDASAASFTEAGVRNETSMDNKINKVISDGAQDIGPETDANSSMIEPAANLEDSAIAVRTAPPIKGEKSVLQRFEEFSGAKGLKELAALFERPGPEEITQEPAIALSDGKTPVGIKLTLQPGERHAPDIALLDAKFVSLQKSGEKSWGITMVPNKGAWKVILIVSTGRETIEFPLVVAPPLKMQNCIDEKNFTAALDKYISDQAAGHIREGQPFRLFFHEYIFTANYLAKEKTEVFLCHR